VSTVSDSPPRSNFDCHQRWQRIRRAELLKGYRAWQAQGFSQRQSAKRLEVPRTTLQAWCAWQARLDTCPQVVEFFESVPGLAFLHRVILALHVVCIEIGAGGIRRCSLTHTLTVPRLKFRRQKLAKGPDVLRHACGHRWCARPPSRTTRTVACTLGPWPLSPQAYRRAGAHLRVLKHMNYNG
jgi:hypothetical protein